MHVRNASPHHTWSLYVHFRKRVHWEVGRGCGHLGFMGGGAGRALGIRGLRQDSPHYAWKTRSRRVEDVWKTLEKLVADVEDVTK